MNNLKYLFFIITFLIPCLCDISAQTIPRDELVFLTGEWEGERFTDGRPKIPDDLIIRAQKIRVEEAWQILHEYGYEYQYEGKWKRIHDDRMIVGRALTAEYLPVRPDLEKNVTERAHRRGHQGRHLHWPINMLSEGDVYVVDPE